LQFIAVVAERSYRQWSRTVKYRWSVRKWECWNE